MADCIENGVRMARMCLHGHIPNLVSIAGKLVRIWYPSQPKTCRNCGADDHLAKDCNSMWCFNCEKSGHVASECPSPIVCSLCLDDEHGLGDCPFYLFSANVVPAGNKAPELLEAARAQAKQDRKVKKEEYAKQVKNATKDIKSGNKDNQTNKGTGKKKDDNRGEKRSRDDRSPDEQHERGDDSDDDARRRKEERRRDDDRRERRDRQDFEEWRELQCKERDRDQDRDHDWDRDRYRERDPSRLDHARDRSDRRDYSDDDDDVGWTLVTSRRKCRSDFQLIISYL